MKVELQNGDRITIPEGCKAIVKDGSVVIEKEKVQEFKDGDVLASKRFYKNVLIFKEYSIRGSFTSHWNMCRLSETGWNTNLFRHATDEEKQLLFDKMKEQGLRWNAEEKRVEKNRWRAKKGDSYYFTDSTDASVLSNHENDDKIDYILWRSYNYFRTEEQAKEAAKRVKEALRKFHEENG